MKIGYKNIEVKEMLIMSEYEFKEYVNRENENTENGENMVKGSHRRSGRKNSKVAGFAKKTGAIVLSAMLFGGVAAGTFQAVNGLGSSTEDSEVASTESNLIKATSVSTASTGSTLDVSDVAAAVMPSVVAITNKSVQEVQNYYSMFGYGPSTTQQESESCGSGIIIGKNDTELLMVTNYHVVEGADSLSVTFVDGQVYEAKIKGTESAYDLAVVAVPLKNIDSSTLSQIAVAAIGDSDSLKVGQQVVAIGNALGYGQSVTTGIVSAVDRTVSTSSSETGSSSSAGSANTYIQTDAAINPGNSGGALVNMKGELVGINSAKIASSEVEGMGYAIPVSKVSEIIERLMNETTRDKVAEENRAALGISVTTVDDSINQTYGIPKGAYVSKVSDDGAAKAAGILPGDVITAFDGKTVESSSGLTELMQYYAAGESVKVTLQTPDNGSYTEKTVTVTLGQAQTTQSQNTWNNSGNVFGGMLHR